MKEITLTKGYVALVDDEDYEYLNQWKWYACVARKTVYAQRCIKNKHERRTVKMHRVILNAPCGTEVDHINHNGLDNRKHNLRICSFNENRKNVSPWGRSKYLGVSIHNKKYFRATIKVNNSKIFLGSFKTEEAAAKAYDEAAIKHHREFANLNFK